MSIIHQNTLLHNVAELTPVSGGVQLQRVPETVRTVLNPGAQTRMLDAAGMEIRFVADGPVKITLSCASDCPEAPAIARLFHGPYQAWGGRSHTWAHLHLTPEPVTLTLPPTRLPLRLPEEVRKPLSFAPQVRRLLLPPLAGPMVIHRIDAEPGVTVRPPTPDEMPRRTLLSYGTSITQGSGATVPHLTYVHQTATRLGLDAVNLGSGGSAHCEPALADYIADRNDWHVATLALSVNMMGFTAEEFRRRVTYMVHTVAGRDPSRPVFAITLWPFHGDYGIVVREDPSIDQKVIKLVHRMRQDLRDAVASCPTRNVHLLEGPDLLRDFAGLTEDLIHPGDMAMVEMGWRLADALRPHLSWAS